MASFVSRLLVILRIRAPQTYTDPISYYCQTERLGREAIAERKVEASRIVVLRIEGNRIPAGVITRDPRNIVAALVSQIDSSHCIASAEAKDCRDD